MQSDFCIDAAVKYWWIDKPQLCAQQSIRILSYQKKSLMNKSGMVGFCGKCAVTGRLPQCFLSAYSCRPANKLPTATTKNSSLNRTPHFLKNHLKSSTNHSLHIPLSTGPVRKISYHPLFTHPQFMIFSMTKVLTYFLPMAPYFLGSIISGSVFKTSFIPLL